MDNNEQEYPEHEKMTQVTNESHIIGQFLEYLNEQGIVLGKYDEQGQHIWPHRQPINERLAEYFNIDLKVIEQEKQQMIQELRNSGDL